MNKKLLPLLVCPKCQKGTLRLSTSFVQCMSCGQEYPVKRGIPVLVDLDNLPRHLSDQVKYFHTEAEQYTASYTRQPWQRLYVDRFIKAVGSCAGKIIIDDACGSGYISLEAAKRGATVIACDLNMAALVRLHTMSKRLKLMGTIFPVCCSSEHLPVKDAAAHAIAANAILEHLPEEKAAIDDITRVTKRHGIAMITVPLAYHLLNPLLVPVNYIHDRRIGHLRRYSKETLVRKFAGWKASAVYYTGHTAKVIKTLVNMIAPVFDNDRIEEEDGKYIHSKLFASNICVMFTKK